MERGRKSVVVVGAGGNIGSHLVPHLGRMAEVGRVVLVDRDRYEEKNVLTQNISAGDVGKAKALVVARQLRWVAPGLRVEAIVEDVRTVPMGRLRGDVVVGCLDSREARRVVNTVAWRLGMPYVDTGVRADGLLARVSVYVPGRGRPCLECAWDEEDYRALEQVYPCVREVGAGATPTDAPSALGALAGALGALECQKLLSGRADASAAGREVVVEALHHRCYVTKYAFNASCRFDHITWSRLEPIEVRAKRLTLEEAFRLGRCGRSGIGRTELSVEGLAFVRRMQCVSCGEAKESLRLQGRLRRWERTCRRCGGELVAVGSSLAWSLRGDEAGRGMLGRSLRAMGFREGDIFTVRVGARGVRFEIGGEKR